MIRKLLLSLLLIAAGLAVLHLTIGFENFVSADGNTEDEPIRRTRDERGIGGGIRIGGTDASAPQISVAGSGRFQIKRGVERELPDGVRLFLPTYELDAEDSETIADDLVRLDRVVVRVHRIDDDAKPPREVHIGTIRAAQAFVQLGRDEKGEVSIREDRDMDLRDVVLESTAEARIRGLHLEVARLKTRQSENDIEFWTPDTDEPFALSFAGAQRTSLDGRGLRGTFPSRERRADARLELHVTSRPVLVRGATTVRAQGSLDFVEQAASGVGLVTIRDGVRVDGLPSAGTTASANGSTAFGDLLVGRLVRFQARERDADGTGAKSGAAWRDLRLEGAPARLSSQGLDLTCRALRVLPASDGEPSAFVAEGAPRLTEPGSGLEFRASERIHVVELPRFLGSFHRAFGYTRPDFGRLAGRLVVFEGRSQVVDPTRAIEIEAADGLRVLRSADETGPALILGQGTTVLRGEGLRVDGSQGFEMRQDGARRQVRLGPVDPDATHAYEVVRTLAKDTVRVQGTGKCEFTIEADASTHIELWSPREDVVLLRGKDTLRGIGRLDATLGAGGELRGVTATGAACAIDTTLADGSTIAGTAKSIESRDGQNFVFTGAPDAPAVVDRGTDGRVEGLRVEIFRIGGGRALTLAEGTPAVVRVQSEFRGVVRTVELRGRRLRGMPGTVPAAVLARHAIPGAVPPRVGSDHVFADGDVEVRVVEADGTVSTIARGDDLVLRIDEAAARLRGLPAHVTSTSPDGRRLDARSREIRLLGTDPATQRVTLQPGPRFTPELDLVGESGSPAFRALRIACEVPIVAEGQDVHVDGPVRVRSLAPDGTIDPTGVTLDASEARVRWNPERHEIERITARGKATVGYREIRAHGEVLRVDVTRHVIEVEGPPESPAAVALRGWTYEGSLFRVDYESRRLVAWGPGLQGIGPDR